jgi:N-acetylneuraminic acid mutarotase
LIPNRGWVKIRETNNLFLTKVVQTPDEVCLVIGGANDRNSTNTLSDMTAYSIQSGKIVTEEKAKMLTSRSSHGATINVYRNEIYVAGGYHQGMLTRTCEVYSIEKNEWR